MELWAEYEGKTIDGAFPLNRLLSPEGSSAFFTTSKQDGRQRVIRLIESHSTTAHSDDSGLNFPTGDDDILSRWRGVAALDHPNILKLEDYGQVVVDDTSLVYAVMEPVDANLGDVVGRHLLTLPEAKQLAVSLLSVLEALHAHGFIHQQIQPDHVVAVNEIVKLQCDCIRDAPEGDLGRELKKRDVQDLAALILQALTKQRTLEVAAATASLPLPSPFNQIVRKGIGGEWGLAEIAAALAVAPAHQSSTRSVAASAAPALYTPASASPVSSHASSVPASPAAANLSSTPAASAEPAVPPAAAPRFAEIAGKIETDTSADVSLFTQEPEEDLSRLTGRVAVAITVAVLLIMALTWQFLPKLPPNSPANQSQPTAGSTSNKPSSLTNPAPAATANPAPAAAANSAQPSNAPATPQAQTPAALHAQWRVVAYAYREDGEAKKKAAAINREHPRLHAQAFQPYPAGPHLVTIGGAMDREQAQALAKKARHQGLPRDTYARNYSIPR